jgi:PAS domain S-box-containing protein
VVVYVNPAMSQLTGYSVAELVGRPSQAMHDPRIPSVTLAPEVERLASGQAAVSQWHGQRKDGSAYDVQVLALPLFDPHGNVTHFAIFQRDVTEAEQTRSALDESERRLRLFIEHAPVAIAMLDRELRYLAASGRWLRDFGMSNRPVIGECHYDVFPEIPAAWREIHRRALAGETLRNDEDGFYRPDGQWQWIRWEVQPWRSADGAIGGIVIFSEEITLRKEAEQQLEASQELQRDMLASLSTLIVVIDRSGKIIVTNPAWDKFALDVEAQHAVQLGVGVNYLNICRTGADANVDSAAAMSAGLESILSGAGAEFALEFPCPYHDGKRWFVLQAAPLRSEAGGAVLSFTETTERKLAELAAQASLAKLEAAMASTMDPVFMSDAAGNIVDFNAAFASFHRFKSKGECAKTLAEYPALFELRAADGRIEPFERWPVVRALNGEKATNAEYRIHRKDTNESWFGAYSYAPMRDADGRSVGAVVNIRDITVQKRAEQALRATEELQRAILASLSAHIAVLDGNGTIIAVNPAWEKFTGASSASPEAQLGVGANYLAVCRAATGADAEIAPKVARGLEKILAGIDTEYSTEYPCHDAVQERWFLLQATVLHMAERGAVVAHTDITARKRVELALQASQSRWLAAMGSTTDAFVIVDREANFLEFNDAWVRFLRFPSREACLENSREYFQVLELRTLEGQFVPFEQWTLPRALLGETIANRELLLWQKLTGERWFGSYSAAPIRDAGGAITGAVMVARDVTMQKQAEQALRASEQQLRTILSTVSSGIVIIDTGGIIQSLNPAAERMFGYGPGDLPGQNVSVLMPHPFARDHDSYIARFLETRQPRVIGMGRELVGMRKDGSTFPLEIALSEVEGLGLFTGVIRDISERHALQQHVLEIAADEQRRIGQELHDGTVQELTGLGLIAGTLQQLLRELPAASAGSECRIDEKQRTRLLTLADTLTQRLTETNRSVHALSRGIMPVRIDAEGLRSALEELAATVDMSKSVNCRFECTAHIAIASNTTATHLYRIAQEAVNNALRHGRPSEIDIILRQSTSQLVLQLIDNGVGIDLAAAESKSSRGGGFGLRTMQYRAAVMGGTIHIDRHTPHGGTVVTCTILQGVMDQIGSQIP